MRLLFSIFMCLISLASSCQKQDYTWLTGYSSNAGYSSAFQYWFGISKFDFNQSPVNISYDSLGINFKGATFTMNDESGEPVFYTNGVTVRNSNDQIMQNGDSLHNGYYLQNVFLWHYSGNPNDAAVIVLPNPRNINLYDILYPFVDTNGNGQMQVKGNMRSQIDMEGDFGKGVVLYKDRVFNNVFAGLCLAAVRHANGRDWWLLTMKEGGSCYKTYYYDGMDSIRSMPLQCIPEGASYLRGQTVVHRFSPDGTKMMTVNNEEGCVDFFDFDRCTGSLAFLEKVNFPERIDSVGEGYLFTGCEFSPSGRYAYICGTKRLYQFDMYSQPISVSKQIISYYHKFQQPAPVTYNLSQLGPDGKIYISSRNTTYYIAVINNPDAAGMACNFQDTVKLPSFIKGLPYYPNYRLAALQGSACDTLTSVKDIVEKEKMLKVFPNPAVDVATIDYGYTDWSKGEATMEIANSIGQIVHSQSLPMYSGFQKLQVANYPSGSYTVFIKRGGDIVATGRLVKQ